MSPVIATGSIQYSSVVPQHCPENKQLPNSFSYLLVVKSKKCIKVCLIFIYYADIGTRTVDHSLKHKPYSPHQSYQCSPRHSNISY